MMTARMNSGPLAAFFAVIVAFLVVAGAHDARAQTEDPTFSSNEIVDAGQNFFGAVSRNLAAVVENLFSRYGRPNGYILGEEAGGAFIGGLRYGEGKLFTKNAGDHKIYWQGPSVGWDYGIDGNRTMMLVYDLPNVDFMYSRFFGVSGSAFVIGGLSMTALTRSGVNVVPIRTGIGAHVGVNVGYLKMTRVPRINPF